MDGLMDGQMDKQTIVHSWYYYYHTQPVQSLADKYARKLRRLSRDFATTVVKEPLEDELKMSLFEQTEVLKGEWQR